MLTLVSSFFQTKKNRLKFTKPQIFNAVYSADASQQPASSHIDPAWPVIEPSPTLYHQLS